MHEMNCWVEEKRLAYLYRVISDFESGSPRQILFLELARAADEQAALWARAVRMAGSSPPEHYQPDLPTRGLALAVRYLGPRSMRALLANRKVRGMAIYGVAMPAGDGVISQRPWINAEAGKFRTALHDLNDGLLSNASLILGVAGATGSTAVIVLCGVVCLLVGALSMAVRQYLAMRSEHERFVQKIAHAKLDSQQPLPEEQEELRLMLKAKGLSAPEAERVVELIIADPDRALRGLAHAAFGLNQVEFGEPWSEAVFTSLMFACGALIPLLPGLLMWFGLYSGHVQLLLLTAGVSSVALFVVGAVLGMLAGRHAVFEGIKMLLMGLAAGSATAVIGRALSLWLG